MAIGHPYVAVQTAPRRAWWRQEIPAHRASKLPLVPYFRDGCGGGGGGNAVKVGNQPRGSGGSSQRQRARKRTCQPEGQGQGGQLAIVTEGGGSPKQFKRGPTDKPRTQAATHWPAR